MKPNVVRVLGDKQVKREPESHRIEFPGGTISVERTTTGEYWAHIFVNTRSNPEYEETHMGSKTGVIIDSRIDFIHEEYQRRVDMGEPAIPKIDGAEHAYHIAVRLRLQEIEHG